MKRRLLTSLIGIVVVAFGTLIANLALGNKPLLGLDLQGGASVTLRPAQSGYDPDALPEVANLYREKIEAFNIGEAEVVRQGDTIVVNLPGVKDKDKAIELIGTTGKVTFRPVLARQGGFNGLIVPTTGTTVPGPLVTVPANSSTTTVAPGEVQPDGSSGSSTTAAAATTAAPSTAAPTTAPGGPSRRPSQTATTTPAPSSVAVPTTATPTTAGPSTTAGATTTTTPGAPTTTVPFDPNSLVTPADQDLPGATVFLPDRDGTVLYQLGPEFAKGEEAVSSAKAEVAQDSPGWQVSLTLTGSGLDSWNKAAAECYAKSSTCTDGGMAIVIDHHVISAPVPQISYFSSPDVRITGGASGFKEGDARQLARVLKYGASPIEMKIEASQTVSATLGNDSLRAGVVSGLIGVALVLAFILFYYRRLAFVVVGGLCVSGAMVWSLITMFDTFFVLTLAGVTGIIVSIGVTVDSYVVFFERLKDEVRAGRSLRNSAQRGFASAWRTILAADFVSLLGAGVLWYLSVGSVRGFALFLGLSTLCDMLVAWFFTRPAVILLSRRPSFQQGKVLGITSGEANPAAATTGGAA